MCCKNQNNNTYIINELDWSFLPNSAIKNDELMLKKPFFFTKLPIFIMFLFKLLLSFLLWFFVQRWTQASKPGPHKLKDIGKKKRKNKNWSYKQIIKHELKFMGKH